ncbi:hypothetical protein [Paenibacillus donghaensis]|uniref:Solute-binding protein family 5 domain-containing protein n=1 Tax=Paenibacillus donghaensis TaxID=414771 RepID=A0A2Z2KCB7_9BACL|nr:hypothetical protein [Paenibacillus donghaensis]ASA23484.1 hypothetical protein B9T62_23380 [Paenibacillus donghaensis]
MKIRYKRAVLTTAVFVLVTALASGCTKGNSKDAESTAKQDVTITTARMVGADFTFKNGESTDDNVHTRWAKDVMGITLKNEWTVGTSDAYTTKLRLLLNSNQKLSAASLQPTQ